MSGPGDTKVISVGENDDSPIPNTSTEVRVATSSNRAPGAEQPTSGATTDETTTEFGDERYPVYLNESGLVFVQNNPYKLSFKLSSEQTEPPFVRWVALPSSSEQKGGELPPQEVNRELVAVLESGGKSTSPPSTINLKSRLLN